MYSNIILIVILFKIYIFCKYDLKGHECRIRYITCKTYVINDNGAYIKCTFSTYIMTICCLIREHVYCV